MARKLKLQPQRKETPLVSTFGTKKPQNLETSVVKFSIITREGLYVILHANVLQQITNYSPIRRGPLPQADAEFLQTITLDKLADNICSIEFKETFQRSNIIT